MFVNCSNHNSINWSDEQLEAAHEYGEILDYRFPSVPADASSEEIAKIAGKVAEEVIGLKPDCVMCQGEFTLTYNIVSRLKKAGIKVVAGCSERNVAEKKNEDGTTEKTAIYKFVQFREYE